MSETSIDWAAIHAGLIAPFDPADVDFRPQGPLSEKGNGMALAYIDARAVMDRLDAVVGPENWYGFPDVVIADNAVRVVRYGLTIHGVTKYAIGDAADTEASKSADSDGLKRAGVPWGIGRYLYALPREWVKGEPRGKNWVILDEEIKRLRAKLGGSTKQAPGRAVVAAATPQRSEAAASTLSAADAATIRNAVASLGWGAADCAAYLRQYGVARFGELTADQAAEVVPDLLSKAAEIDAA